MKVMVLGATGYLGTNIVRGLVEMGYRVFGVIRDGSDICNVVSLDVTLVKNNIEQIEDVLRKEKIDWIINTICTYKKNNSLYGDMLDSNIIFPLSVLNIAIKNNVKNFITMGTSLPDEFNLYSFSKKHFSDFGKYLSEIEEMNFIDLKLEMFYGGEYNPDDRFISYCKKKLLKNDDLELTKGVQKRDIIRVEDIVSLIMRLIQTNYFSGYNALPVGTGENHSIREIVSYMKEKLRSKSTLLWGAVPQRKNEPDTLADVRWYKKIGFELKYDFFSGLDLECNNTIYD